MARLPAETTRVRAQRRAACVALLLLGGALVVATVVTTPWQALPDTAPGVGSVPDPTRDFTAQQLSREDAFHRALRPASYLSLVVGLAVALLLGLTRWGARLIGAAAGRVRGWAWRVLIGGIVLALVAEIVTLPFGIWAETALRRYGLSTQTWASWTLDQLKGLGLNTALLLGAFLALYTLVRAFPRGWWAPAAAGSFALVVMLSFVYPLVVEPVFNRFQPMPEGGLRSDLVALARKDGVPVREVLVADASRRTTTLNAYVSGFGSTRRIVVYDTLLERASPGEVRLIVAHELGHADEGDVLFGTLLGALGTSAGVCLLYLVTTWPRTLRRAGVGSVGDPRSLALVLALVAVFGTLTGPVQNLVSRHIEARADAHALNLTEDPATFARMQRQLAVRNLSDLDPPRVHHLLFASHPTAPERIAMARTWARLHHVPEPPPLAAR